MPSKATTMDWWQSVDLAAICSEIKHSSTHRYAILSTLALASNGAEEEKGPKVQTHAQHSTTINDDDNNDADDANRHNHAKITIGNDATTTIYQIWCIQQLAATSTATKGPNQYPTSDDNELPTDDDDEDTNSTAFKDYNANETLTAGHHNTHPPRNSPMPSQLMIFAPTMTLLNGCSTMDWCYSTAIYQHITKIDKLQNQLQQLYQLADQLLMLLLNALATFLPYHIQ